MRRGEGGAQHHHIHPEAAGPETSPAGVGPVRGPFTLSQKHQTSGFTLN